ncbi:acidic mammalian chitinase-like isoform X2 [Malaya genurostris]|uniref:acidic mammalian chitinase-like isoform X2 n=1 Tax=Malaya genurostris TaxID=325434 RepID=UPI0026F3FD7E|nr:acidic mammalian chitinase-like isoform X2 [Malaya genurostris]
MKIYLLLGLLFGAVSALSAATGNVFCFYKTGAAYRVGNGRVAVTDLDPNRCTHLVYQYVKLQANGAIQTLDLDTGELQQFVKLKSSGHSTPKILVSIGGPHQGSNILSALFAVPSLRRTTAISIFNFVNQYGLDGIDFHWQWPVLNGGNPVDRINFPQLLTLLQEKLQPTGKILSISVAPTKDYFWSSYNVTEIKKYVNFVNIMAFDLHAYWNGRTGHNAPVYRALAETSIIERELNVDFILTGWISAGMDPAKIILGVSANGHSFKLANTSIIGVQARTIGPGPSGTYTAETGVQSYLEVCETIQKGGWNTVWDTVQKAYYAYKSTTWLSFESLASLENKIKMARDKSIGGLAIWDMEGDDVRNICGGGKFTLLSYIFSQLYDEAESETTVTTTTTTTTSTTTTTTASTTTALSHYPEYCPASGYYRDPLDCASFYRCVGGAKFTILGYHTCPSGLHFDSTANVCNYPKSAKCG